MLWEESQAWVSVFLCSNGLLHIFIIRESLKRTDKRRILKIDTEVAAASPCSRAWKLCLCLSVRYTFKKKWKILRYYGNIQEIELKFWTSWRNFWRKHFSLCVTKRLYLPSSVLLVMQLFLKVFKVLLKMFVICTSWSMCHGPLSQKCYDDISGYKRPHHHVLIAEPSWLHSAEAAVIHTGRASVVVE